MAQTRKNVLDHTNQLVLRQGQNNVNAAYLHAQPFSYTSGSHQLWDQQQWHPMPYTPLAFQPWFQQQWDPKAYTTWTDHPWFQQQWDAMVYMWAYESWIQQWDLSNAKVQHPQQQSFPMHLLQKIQFYVYTTGGEELKITARKCITIKKLKAIIRKEMGKQCLVTKLVMGDGNRVLKDRDNLYRSGIRSGCHLRVIFSTTEHNGNIPADQTADQVGKTVYLSATLCTDYGFNKVYQKVPEDYTATRIDDIDGSALAELEEFEEWHDALCYIRKLLRKREFEVGRELEQLLCRRQVVRFFEYESEDKEILGAEFLIEGRTRISIREETSS